MQDPIEKFAVHHEDNVEKEFEKYCRNAGDPNKMDKCYQETIICPRCAGTATALDAYYGDYYCAGCGEEIQTRILSKGIRYQGETK
jgi:hypothetical protein